MKVYPILGEPLRFRVQSESQPRQFYLVELDALNNNGACDCKSFLYRHAPLIKNPYDKTVRQRCKHILAAREFFLDRWLELLSAEMKDKHGKPHKQSFDGP